jgi:hypothetical protein
MIRRLNANIIREDKFIFGCSKKRKTENMVNLELRYTIMSEKLEDLLATKESDSFLFALLCKR